MLDFSVYKRIKWRSVEGERVAIPIDSNKCFSEWKKCGKHLADIDSKNVLDDDCYYFGFNYGGTDHQTRVTSYTGTQSGSTITVRPNKESRTRHFFLNVHTPCENEFVCYDKKHIVTKWINAVNKPTRSIWWWIISVALIALCSYLLSAGAEAIGGAATVLGVACLIVSVLMIGSIIYRLVLNSIRKKCVRIAKRLFKENGGRVVL